MKSSHGLLLGLVSVLLFLGPLAAQSTPQTIKMQGFLSDQSGGSGVPADGSFSMTFDLYTSELGGLLIKSVGPLSVDATDGLYSVDLPFLTAHFAGSDRWIEITVEGETLAPRVRVASMPFAYKADRLDGFEGADLEESVEIVAGDTHLQAQIDSINPLLPTTLDDAYDEGGPGAGRTINADSGPVSVEGPNGMHVTGPLGIGAGQLDWSAASGGIPAHFGSDSPLEVTRMAIGSMAEINSATSFGFGPVLEDRALVVEEMFDLEDPHQNVIVGLGHVDPATGASGDLTGVLGWLETETSVTESISELEAVIGVVAHRANSHVDFARGLRSRVWMAGDGPATIGEATGLDVEIRRLGSGSVSAGNIYYLKLNTSAALPATGNAYGLYMGDLSPHSSSSYSIYSAGSNDVAYFAGDVGIKTANPRSALDINPGTGHGQVTLDGSAGGCLMMRDTDDAGWTECNTLDGTLSCSIDADGVCDGS